ncbi:MAG: glycosyltransferase family 2 protein [Chloroflexi bacterium]|nr:glycosyltransferase family 2 protein [Chloroflexota bacterium]
MYMTSASLFFTYASRLVRKDIPLKMGKVEAWPENTPFVSVVIPCYNHGQYVDEAVESVLGQTWQNFEIIIVNDGSTEEETLDILKDFTRPKTRILHLPKNMGLPAARNAGIEKARGKYICCLDADDKLQATYLEKAVATMEVNAGLSFVWSWTQVFGNESRVWYTPQFDPYKIIYANQTGPSAVFKRSAWEQAGGFQEDMREGFEDWEFWIRLTGNGYRGQRISENLIYYRRMGYSFALRAAEKMDALFERIKFHNPNIYDDPKDAIDRAAAGYCDVYSNNPFANLNNERDYLKGIASLQLIVSGLGSEDTTKALKGMDQTARAGAPLIWVANKALDESTIDLLYETTPFVYILPNFLPQYARREFIHNLQAVWNISSIQYFHKK